MDISTDDDSEPKQTYIGMDRKNALQNSDVIKFKLPSLTLRLPRSRAEPELDEDSSVVEKKITQSESENNEFPKPPTLSEHELPNRSDAANKEVKSSLVNSSTLSPAEQLKELQVIIPYKEPEWGGPTEDKYSLEVLKNGTIMSTIDLTEKSFHICGRLPSCDLTMEHPSLSRHHAVIQYCSKSTDNREQGWYLYDMDSTHGTWINKKKVLPNTFCRIHVGHVLKFGGSSRLYILQGPESDVESESELTVTELVQQKERQKKEIEVLRQVEMMSQESDIKADIAKKDEGCSWGISDDAEEDITENPFAPAESTENESLYIDDPKKALKGFFEREGYDMPEYEFVDAGKGKFRCTVELPIDAPSGGPLTAEATISGKKKETVIACAMEACKILDRQGLLRASTHESRKRKSKDWAENDFYDSDEDIYLDRTGAIEKKRQTRMKKAGKMEEKTENYEGLLQQHTAVRKEIEEIESKLADAKAQEEAMQSDDVDALDAYMLAIKSGIMDTKTRLKLKRQLIELKKDEQRLRKLVNIAKPASMPELKHPAIPTPVSAATKPGNFKPMFGKIKGLGSQHRVPKLPIHLNKSNAENEEYEVEEDDDDNDKATSASSKSDDRLKLQPPPSDSPQKQLVKGPVRGPVQDQQLNIRKSDLVNSEQKSCVSIDKASHSDVTLVKNILTNRSSCDSKREEKSNSGDGDQDVALVKSLLKSASKKSEPSNRALGTKAFLINQEMKESKKSSQIEFDPDDPDYVAWNPPQGQSGDGKTHLNAKFGY